MLTDLALPFAPPFALSLPTLLGVLGFVIYAGADIALCLGRITSAGIAFYLLNSGAALLIGISLLYSFNLGAFLTELFCLGVSVLAVVLRLRQRRAAMPGRTTSMPMSRPARSATLQGARPMPSPMLARPGHGLCPDRVI